MNRKFHDDYTTTTGGNPGPIRKKLIAPFQDVPSKQQSAVTQAFAATVHDSNAASGGKVLGLGQGVNNTSQKIANNITKCAEGARFTADGHIP